MLSRSRWLLVVACVTAVAFSPLAARMARAEEKLASEKAAPAKAASEKPNDDPVDSAKPAADSAKPAADSDNASSTAASAENLQASQQKLANDYKDFQGVLMRYRDIIRQTDPNRAALIEKALKESGDRGVESDFTDILKLMHDEQLGRAATKQFKVKDDMEAILDLLRSEDRSRRLEDEKTAYRKFLARVNDLIHNQIDLHGRNVGGDDPKALSGEQGALAKQTGNLNQDIRDHEQMYHGAGQDDPKNDNKGGGKNDGKDGDNKDGKQGDGKSKPGDGKSGDKAGKDSGKPGGKEGGGKEGGGKESAKSSAKEPGKSDGKEPGKADGKEPGKSDSKEPGKSDGKEGAKSSSQGDGKPGEGAKSQAKNQPSKGGSQSKSGSKGQPSKSQGQGQGQGQDDDNPDQPPQQAQDQNSPQQQEESPLRKRLQSAEEHMKEAQRRLEKAKRDGAADEQEKAVEDLRIIKDELENILRQLREEEMRRLLAMLEGRIQKVLATEREIYDGTVRLEKVPVAERSHGHEIESGRLSAKQGGNVTDVKQALSLLREDGTAVAMPEALEQVRDDMQQLVLRLGQGKTEVLTQSIESDVIKQLEEVVEALKKERKKLEDNKKKPPSSSPNGEPQDPPLIEMISELKMIRALQNRVNDRTARYSKLIQGEQTKDADVFDALHRLSEQQNRVKKITRDLEMGKNE